MKKSRKQQDVRRGYDRERQPSGVERGRQRSVRSERRNLAKQEKTMEKENRRGNGQILILTYVIAGVFLCMIGYFVYFMVEKSETIINNPYNKRQEVLAKKVQRGEVRSADGKVLAKTKTDKQGKDTRVYPYGEMYAHVVGRITNSMTGIEAKQCYPMLTSHINPFEKLVNTFQGNKSPGDNVVTTLNSKLQKTAYEALGGNKGAVVAIEPSTGKILAMVSKPSYDPNTVAADWDTLIQDSKEESALVNRATQGLYPPGSTFKIITALEYILENPETYSDFRYNCKGSDVFKGYRINCYDREVHGRVSLKSAFAKSCNGAFAQIGTTLQLDSYRKLVEKFGFNKELSVDFEYNKSRFLLTKDSDMGELTQTVMGQGKTTITPLENAMIVASLANNGVMMNPYVVDHVESENGQIVKQYHPKENAKVVDKNTAQIMKTLMKAVVKRGTAHALRGLSYDVAGKTGSAEADSKGTTHAWFVGYAPAENPTIAISVVVEGAGTGSQYAVPIARKMLSAYIGR